PPAVSAPKPRPVPPPETVVQKPRKRTISSEALMAASPASITRAPVRDLSGDGLAARLVDADKQSLTRKIEEISRQVESRPAAKTSAPKASAASTTPRMITVPAKPLRAPEAKMEQIRAETPAAAPVVPAAP